MRIADTLGELGHLEERFLTRLGLALEAGASSDPRDRGDDRIAEPRRFVGHLAAEITESREVPSGVEILEQVDPLCERDHEVVDCVLQIRNVLELRQDRLSGRAHTPCIGNSGVGLKMRASSPS